MINPEAPKGASIKLTNMAKTFTSYDLEKIYDVVRHLEPKITMEMMKKEMTSANPDYNESPIKGHFHCHIWNLEMVIEPIENMFDALTTLTEALCREDNVIISYSLKVYSNDTYFGYLSNNFETK